MTFANTLNDSQNTETSLRGEALKKHVGKKLNWLTCKTAYIVELRCINTKAPIAIQMISKDAGSMQRRALAERLCDKYSDPRDCYVIEYEMSEESRDVINKYQL